MQVRSLAYLQLSVAMVTVGSTVIASKIIGQGIDAYLATAVRLAIALPAFLVLIWIKGALSESGVARWRPLGRSGHDR